MPKVGRGRQPAAGGRLLLGRRPDRPPLALRLPQTVAGKARKAARKGMTLEQIEAAEGGPVKESMVGMAHTRRAARRKGAAVGDTDIVEDVEDIEEELEQEEEDGIKLEAFNLKASGVEELALCLVMVPMASSRRCVAQRAPQQGPLPAPPACAMPINSRAVCRQGREPPSSRGRGAARGAAARVPAADAPGVVLQEERQRGYFDASGNYVEKEDKDAEQDAADAWLQSDEGGLALGPAQMWWWCQRTAAPWPPPAGRPAGSSVLMCVCQVLTPPACCGCLLCPALPAAKVVSDEVRRKIEEAQTRAAAAEAAAGPLSATQIARLQFQASQVLHPGETVAAALKRLGGHSRRPAKRSRQAGRGGDEPADMAADVAPDPAAKQQFNQLTEAAMKLMDAGENDVYSQNKVLQAIGLALA